MIGSGTVLDTARFCYLLSEHLGVHPRNVNAHVIGEHGNSEVPVWSLATVAGMQLDDFCRLEDCDLRPEIHECISEQTCNAA